MDLFKNSLGEPAFQAVLTLARAFREKGGRALLVGGAVRDALQGLPAKDFDLEVHNLPGSAVRQCAESCFEVDAVGMSFGVLKIKHLEIDIALPRRENKTGAGHRGFLIEECPDLSFAESSARRDFTVNAIMFDPLTQELIDPHHGVEDLKAGILRHVSPHFVEDPLRVLRGMQFSSRLGFPVAPETIALCSQLDQSELAVERIGTEWEKLLLKSRKPSMGLNFLKQCGWIRFYPELERLIHTPQHAVHHAEGDAFVHTCMVMDEAVHFRTGEIFHDLLLMGTALTHDFGKPATLQITPEKISSPGHAAAGVEEARRFLRRMWNRPELIEYICTLVRYHMDAGWMGEKTASDGEFRRMALKTQGLHLLYELFVSDVKGCGAPPDRKAKILACGEVFKAKAQALGIWENAPHPLLQGRDLIARGIAPGPRMGQLLQTCFEAQLDGQFSDRSGGELFLEKML